MDTLEDNGLGLARHTFVLFISIVLSSVFHFGLMYCFGEMRVEPPSHVSKAHITPQNLPPVRIEAFVRKTDLVQAPSAIPPNPKKEAEAIGSTLPTRAQDVRIAEPTSPEIPIIPANIQTSALFFAEPTSLPQLTSAPPRQIIAFIPETPFTVKTNPSPRWIIDATQHRIPNAPDLTSAVETIPVEAPPSGEEFTLAQAQKLNASIIVNKLTSPPPLPIQPENDGQGNSTSSLTAKITEQTIQNILTPSSQNPRFETTSQAIDDCLDLSLSTYESPDDSHYRYFRLNITRKTASALPVMPKDVIFIQDISGSIKQDQLNRSKAALKTALFNTLRFGDRFNIFAFRNTTLTPSGTWLTFDPTTRIQTETFIDSLRARGSTDLFLFLKDLFSMPQENRRPLFAVIVTDGEPTTGLRNPTKIIGEFTRLNQGRISIYAFGIKAKSHYFLDMLCYANRGESVIFSGEKVGFSKELTSVLDSIRNPVMQNISLLFDTTSGGEIHPQKLTPLYADRPLVVYGRVPKATKTVTCQLQGVSATQPYNAVFSFTFQEAISTRQDLRRLWAERAMFDLVAEYAETLSPVVLQKINTLSQQYTIPNPYDL